MNSIFKILNHRFAYHIYFWGLFYLVFVFFGSGSPPNLNYGLRMSFAFIFPWMIACYIQFFIHTRFFNKRKYLIYILLIILILIFASKVLLEISSNGSFTSLTFIPLAMVLPIFLIATIIYNIIKNPY